MKGPKIIFKHAKKFIICLFFASVFLFNNLCFSSDPAASSIAQLPGTITLDIKGMDILDVLKIISMKSGLNIIAGRNVTGKVTIYLKDVDLWDAFEIILVANNLAYERKGDIVNVMTDRDYELIYGDKFYDKKELQIIKLNYAKAADVSKALLQMKTNIGKIIIDEGSNTIVLVDVPSRVAQMKQMIEEVDVPVETKVFSLKYAKAEEMEKKISELVTKNVGIVRIDVRTNKVIVTDLPERLDKIEKMITEFDQKDYQVMIEAKILDVELKDEFKTGIDWSVIADKYFKLTQTLKLSLTEGAGIRIGTLAGGGNPEKEGDYSGLIEALREVGDVNTLSAPRIMALNNQESKILVGTKEAYITSSSSQAGESTVTSQSVNFVDTGIKLYVTPTVNKDGFVTMKIKPEISSATSTDIKSADQVTEVPIVSTSEAETTIMVKDGSTIIMAGLIKDVLNKNIEKIPLLGDIPLIGKVFGNNSDVKSKREIVILLTPHIVTGEFTFNDGGRWQRYENSLNKIKDRLDKEDLILKQQSQKQGFIQNKTLEKQKVLPLTQESQSVLPQASKPTEVKINQEQKKTMSLRLDVQNAAFKEAMLFDKGYNNYFIDVKKDIQNNMINNFSDLELAGEAVVSFVLDSQGNLKAEPKVISEDNKLLGDVLLESVRLASPFGSFPKEFDAQEEIFTITLSFE